MESRDAQEIVRMVESTWAFDLGAEGRQLWRELLEPYAADTATRGLAELAKTSSRRPAFADLRSAMMRISRTAAEEARRKELPPAPTGRPSWVTRWEQARAAGDTRPLPEQAPGIAAMQRLAPENVDAYEAPAAPEHDRESWVQPDEYPLTEGPTGVAGFRSGRYA